MGPVRKQVVFLMKIKDFTFLFKIIFLKKRITQLSKFIKETFKFKTKNSTTCFWCQISKISYVGQAFIFQSFISVFTWGQSWWLYQTIAPSYRKVFQGKSVILYFKYTFFLFPRLLVCLFASFSSTNFMLLGQVFTFKRCFLLSLSDQ